MILKLKPSNVRKKTVRTYCFQIVRIPRPLKFKKFKNFKNQKCKVK